VRSIILRWNKFRISCDGAINYSTNGATSIVHRAAAFAKGPAEAFGTGNQALASGRSGRFDGRHQLLSERFGLKIIYGNLPPLSALICSALRSCLITFI